MTLKLLVIAEGYPWGDNLAGVFHREQFRLMAAAGLDVTVVGPTPWVPPFLVNRNRRWRQYAEAPRRQQENGVTIRRPRYLALPRENALFYPDVAQYLAVSVMSLPRPDVIQAFFALPHGAVARRLSQRWGVPYAVGMLGDDVNIYPHHNTRSRNLLTDVVRDAAWAFANGPTLAATATQLTGIDVEALSIGAARGRFANLPSREEARRQLGWPQERFIALYVGALIPTKGIDELIAAADLVKNEEITIAAVGDGQLRGELERRSNAVCLGVRPASDVTAAMAAADVLVHPSHYEGLPTALVEAAFARLPIITTDAPGCVDLARDGRGVMVPVGDAQALAGALRQAKSNREAGWQHAELMFQHACAHYDIEVNTNRLIEKYQALAVSSYRSQ